ncbi:MAG: hypothetical protein F4018_01915 [Acidobacteria bacterium]|nr:hypothetical protein [Acidobacteriota bacterium]MYK87191.1 hypothetical protein [Acidobacteriota bacterium]
MMTRRTRTTTVLGFTAVALAAAFSGAGIHAQSDVSGIWQIDLDTQTGEQTWTVTFEQNGATLGGEIDMHDGEGTLPVEGSVDGNTIAFVFIVPDLDGDMPINLSGEIDGATIAGDEGHFVWYGSGDWTARKR